MDPQPDPDRDVVEMTRKYAKMKDGSLERHIVRLVKCGGEGAAKVGYCVVMYVGESRLGNPPPHGNSRVTQHPFRTTNKHILEKGRLLLGQGKKPRQVQMEMMMRDPSIDHPRDLRQLQNLDYAMCKDYSMPCATISDEILQVISAWPKSDFIQGLLWIHKDTPPAIVLFKKQQIDDFVQMCSLENAHEFVTAGGFDKTYNISSAFLSAIVFPNKKIEREGQHPRNWPTWLGPILLHWRSDKSTYTAFFECIKSQMRGCFPEGFAINTTKLMLGNDEEQAIVSSVDDTFPNAIKLLCLRHISENLKHHISGFDWAAKEKERLHHKIMSLAECKDLDDFKLRSSLIVEEVTREVDREQAEYIEKIIAKLLRYSVEPRLREGTVVIPNFTNNRSESYNSYLKLIFDHQPQKIQKLIERLEQIVGFQEKEMKAALHNCGDFRLIREFKKLAISDETWSFWTENRRDDLKDEAVEKLRRARFPEARPNTVFSTDGNLEMPRVNKTAKKPNQEKTPREERTRNRSRSRSLRRKDRQEPW